MAWDWPQYVVAIYLVGNCLLGIYREGKAAAKGQHPALTFTAVVILIAAYGGLAYTLHVGGFWNA